MKLRVGIVAAALALAVTARGDNTLSQPVVDALTAIDQSPTTAELTNVLAEPPLANLVTIAYGGGEIDPGVQLRAVQALSQYTTNPSDLTAAHTALATLLTSVQYGNALSGTDVLILRAALEAMGSVGHAEDNPAADVPLLAAFLDHGSRDVRTTTARALRDLGSSQAIAPLRTRLAVESVPQVQLAISEALRVLPQL